MQAILAEALRENGDTEGAGARSSSGVARAVDIPSLAQCICTPRVDHHAHLSSTGRSRGLLGPSAMVFHVLAAAAEANT